MKTKILSSLVILTLLVCLVTVVFNHQSAQASVPHLTLAITSIVATDHKTSHVTAHTLANAALTITVLYFCTNHIATSKSLKGIQHASSVGNYTWLWTPDTKCHGNAKATVIAKEYGQTVTAVKTFIVH